MISCLWQGDIETVGFGDIKSFGFGDIAPSERLWYQSLWRLMDIEWRSENLNAIFVGVSEIEIWRVAPAGGSAFYQIVGCVVL